jgi:hypothetical protein
MCHLNTYGMTPANTGGECGLNAALHSSLFTRIFVFTNTHDPRYSHRAESLGRKPLTTSLRRCKHSLAHNVSLCTTQTWWKHGYPCDQGDRSRDVRGCGLRTNLRRSWRDRGAVQIQCVVCELWVWHWISQPCWTAANSVVPELRLSHRRHGYSGMQLRP